MGRKNQAIPGSFCTDFYRGKQILNCMLLNNPLSIFNRLLCNDKKAGERGQNYKICNK